MEDAAVQGYHIPSTTSHEEYLSKFLKETISNISKIQNFDRINGKHIQVEGRLYNALYRGSGSGAIFVLCEENSDNPRRLIVEAYGSDSYYLAAASKKGDRFHVGGDMDARRPIPKIRAKFVINQSIIFSDEELQQV